MTTNTFSLDTVMSYLSSAVRILNSEGRYVLADKVKDLYREVDALRIDPNGPLTAEQRAALFANFGEVFGDTDSERRYAFTRMVLGRSVVSWSAHKAGRLTYAEAGKVLDALDALNV